MEIKEMNQDLKDFLFRNFEEKIKNVRFDLTNMRALPKKKGQIQCWVCDVETWVTDCNGKEYLFDLQTGKEWGGDGIFSVCADMPFKVLTLT